MTAFNEDRIRPRPQPDRELRARAHNHMLASETPMEGYLRQQWETAISATRVALEAWRVIWPVESADNFEPDQQALVVEAARALESAYSALDRLSLRMLGTIMHATQRGEMTVEWLGEAGA